jgi:predicted ATP-grasp superfamily ATP-dependent carboligase
MKKLDLITCVRNVDNMINKLASTRDTLHFFTGELSPYIKEKKSELEDIFYNKIDSLNELVDLIMKEYDVKDELLER